MDSFDSKNASPASTLHHRSGRHPGEPSGDPWLLMLVDAGIAGSLIVLPFVMGGRTPIGQLAFVGLALWASFCWSLHQLLGHGDRLWRHTLAFWPIAIALGLVLLQLAPLPPSWLAWLSPRIAETLPLWTPGEVGQTTLGTWSTLSLTPETTRRSLLLLFAGAMLFWVTVQRIQRVGDVERIIRWLAISVSLMAAFGIVQFLSSNGKFFWIVDHPYSRTDDCVKGAFTNRNHFAQFLSLGFGALLWWTFAGRSSASQPSSRDRFRPRKQDSAPTLAFKFLLVPLCALALFMSFSRGGVLAFLASGTTALYLLFSTGKLSRRMFAALAGLGLIVCLGLSIYGYEALANRFESTRSLASLEGRSRLWSAACKGFSEHLLFGTGMASHGSVYPLYLKPEAQWDSNLYYTHAENGYVQVALETGLVGLVAAVAVIAIYLVWCARTLATSTDSRTILCFVAVLPALLANVVHSATDYVWYVPGCMAVVAVMAGCACRLYQLHRDHTAGMSPLRPLPRFAWMGVAVLLALVSLSGIPRFWRASRADVCWNRYLFLKQSLAELNRETAGDDVAAGTESRRQILAAMIDELSNVLDIRPEWGLAHLCKAQTHRDLFHEIQSTAENQFDLRMIRETVVDNFDSIASAREWLSRAVGEHSHHLDAALGHAHRAAQLEPLEGEAYLLLAELSFLEESPVPSKLDYITQAFRVRPHDGKVLFEIGSELALAGRYDRALDYLKLSFQCGREHQQRLIQALSGTVPASEFLQTFQPDADALQLMVGHYSRPELVQELQPVLAAHATACEAKARSLPEREAAAYWTGAAGSYGRLQDPVRQRDCLQHAITADSFNFDTRLALGRVCLTLEDFDEAARQLRWCTQRKPGHPAAEKLLEQAVGKGIAASHQTRPVQEAGRVSTGLWR